MPLLKQIVEALVFASQKPLTPREIAGALKTAADEGETPELKAFGKTKEAEIAPLLEELQRDLEQAGYAYQLVEQVNGWHFVTRASYAPWVRQLFPESKPIRLSGPALETLAIISYRQPITRADIEAVRGVAVDSMVNMLVDRQLIRIAGRAEVPGRPLLYETTEHFLVHFGLRNLDELPNASELRRIEIPSAPAPVVEKAAGAPAEPALPETEPELPSDEPAEIPAAAEAEAETAPLSSETP